MVKIILAKTINLPLSLEEITNLARQASKLEPKINGLIEVTAVNNQAMRRLNKQYRGISATTDVLSFAWQEDKQIKSEILGQIYLSPVKLRNQAKEWGVSWKEETARMFVHGLLHLVGYDHLKPKQAQKMFKLQEVVLEKFGIKKINLA